jgi:hypothetical protein
MITIKQNNMSQLKSINLHKYNIEKTFHSSINKFETTRIYNLKTYILNFKNKLSAHTLPDNNTNTLPDNNTNNDSDSDNDMSNNLLKTGTGTGTGTETIKLMNFCKFLYEKAYSALDVIYVLENDNTFTEQMAISIEKKYELLLTFYKVKKEFRNECLLFFFIFHFMMNDTACSLEGISFI